jgi:hypothetical protein
MTPLRDPGAPTVNWYHRGAAWSDNMLVANGGRGIADGRLLPTNPTRHF